MTMYFDLSWIKNVTEQFNNTFAGKKGKKIKINNIRMSRNNKKYNIGGA